MKNTHTFAASTLAALGIVLITPMVTSAQYTPSEEGRPNLSEEVKDALRSCHEDHAGDFESMRSCAETVLTENGVDIDMLKKRVRRFAEEKLNIPQEAQDALVACKDAEATHEEVMSCAKGVAEEYDIQLPPRIEHMKEKIMNIPEEAREELQDCRDSNDSHEGRRACAAEVLESYNIELPEHAPENRRRRGGRSGRFFNQQ